MSNCANKYTLLIKVIGGVMMVSSQRVVANEMDDLFSLSPAELANIPVTIATGTAKPMYHSAAITTVITAQQIQNMGATELNQVLETVPGLHVNIQAVTNDPIYSMRGMLNPVGAEVLLLLNGTRYNVPYKGSAMTGMNIPVAAIQRIEVIRGPGSALYGADAFAGVINIVTKKAEDIAGTEVGVRGGSWDTQSIWGLHGDEWLGWNVAATLQYTHNNNDEDRVIQTDTQSQFDAVFGTQASLAPGVMQTKAERWNAHLQLQRKHWDVGFWAYSLDNAGLKAGAGGALDDEGVMDGKNYLADIRYSSEDNLKDWTFLAHASYLYSDVEANVHNFPDGAVLPIDNKGHINPTLPFILTPAFFPQGLLSVIGIENQVASFEVGTLYKGFNPHLLRITAGYRYEQVQTHDLRNYGTGVLNGSESVVDGHLTDLTGTDWVFLPDSQRSIGSLSIQDEWRLAKNWELILGLRYDHYSDFGETFNPRAALIWDMTPQLTSKLLYGRAFRAPSFLEQKQQNSQLFSGTPNIKPETIDTVELGFDYRPYAQLRTTANIFYYQIHDLIGDAIDTSMCSIPKVDNLQGQTAYGFELEGDWQFHEQWHFRANYAWQQAQNDRTYRFVDYMPKHQVYAALAWQFMPKWQLQTQINWLGGRRIPAGANQDALQDYETIDVSLTSQRFWGGLDFTASVRNVFNAQGKEAAVSTLPNNIPIASRSFYVQASWHF